MTDLHLSQSTSRRNLTPALRLNNKDYNISFNICVWTSHDAPPQIHAKESFFCLISVLIHAEGNRSHV